MIGWTLILIYKRIYLMIKRDPLIGFEQCLEGNLPLTEPHSMGSTSKPPPSPGEKQLYFLATKVVAPRCQGLIERPRLLDVTSQLSGKQLAVLKAPAGFGKTSLAATWL